MLSISEIDLKINHIYSCFSQREWQSIKLTKYINRLNANKDFSYTYVFCYSVATIFKIYTSKYTVCYTNWMHTAHLVGVTKSVLWYKKCKEWKTLKCTTEYTCFCIGVHLSVCLISLPFFLFLFWPLLLMFVVLMPNTLFHFNAFLMCLSSCL